jgi:hypothetical protein
MSLNFTHKRGDTFYAVPFEIKKDNVAIDLSDTVIKMQVRQNYGGAIVLNFDSTDDVGITITDAVAGKFKIDEQIIDIPAYNYIYDIQFNFDGIIRTYVSGNFLITNDVTR